jgi:hypothetical protein
MPGDMLYEIWLGLKRFWALRWIIKGPTLAFLVFVVLVIIVFATWSEAEFTAEEKVLVERLTPILDTLVIQQDDLYKLVGNYEDCQGSGDYYLDFTYKEHGDAANVKGVKLKESSDGYQGAKSLYCEAHSDAFVSSIVELPQDKEELLELNPISRGLAEGRQEDLERLVEATSDNPGGLGPIEQAVSYRWLSAPTLGETRYAWVRNLVNADTGEESEIYHFDFNRGVVMAALLVKLPNGPAAEVEARALAAALDQRIAAQLQLLAVTNGPTSAGTPAAATPLPTLSPEELSAIGGDPPPPPGEIDPCTLVTKAEAEEILEQPVVEVWRHSHFFGGGNICEWTSGLGELFSSIFLRLDTGYSEQEFVEIYESMEEAGYPTLRPVSGFGDSAYAWGAVLYVFKGDTLIHFPVIVKDEPSLKAAKELAKIALQRWPPPPPPSS